MPKNVFATVYLVDASVSVESMEILKNGALKGWYMGEANPSFLKKIPELRNHLLSAASHRKKVWQHLPDYGEIDDSVYDEEADDGALLEKFPVISLGLLFHGGEIILNFAGPCILIHIRAAAQGTIFTQKEIFSLDQALDGLTDALEQSGHYHILNAEDISNALCLSQLKESVHERIARANKAEDVISRAQKIGHLLFLVMNAAIVIGLIFLLGYGIKTLNTITGVETNNVYSFVVQKKVNENHRVVLPDLKAYGYIRETGEKTHLDLYRDEFISVSIGYELLVMKTKNPENPYMLAWYVEKHSPVNIGPFKINIEIFIWFVATALWLNMFLKYVSAKKGFGRENIRRALFQILLWLSGGIGLAIVFIWIKSL